MTHTTEPPQAALADEITSRAPTDAAMRLPEPR